jgi:DNA-binding SARP family transcriptional activator
LDEISVTADVPIFRILGPLEVASGAVAIHDTKRRLVLAILLLHANHACSRDLLIDSLWGEDAPRDKRHIGNLQGYVSKLRTQFRETGLPADVTWEEPGYVLHVAPAQIDLRLFEERAKHGLRELVRNDYRGAAQTFREALALWRGTMLEEFDVPIVREACDRADDVRLDALEGQLEAEVELGYHATAIDQLQALTHDYPDREQFALLLMKALYLGKRKPEALEVYKRTRDARSELGIDPTPALNDLQQKILNDHPDLAPRVAGDWLVEVPLAALNARLRNLGGRATQVPSDGGYRSLEALRLVEGGELSPFGTAYLDCLLAEDESGQRAVLADFLPSLGLVDDFLSYAQRVGGLTRAQAESEISRLARWTDATSVGRSATTWLQLIMRAGLLLWDLTPDPPLLRVRESSAAA